MNSSRVFKEEDVNLFESFVPDDEHQHDLKEAYFDLGSESSLVLGVDALLTLQQRRHCIKTRDHLRSITPGV